MKALLASTTVRPRLIGLALASAVALLAILTLGGAQAARNVGPSPYQLLLRARVDDANGAPRLGRDPAAQAQQSLAEAARKPNGIGTWGGEPARNVKPGKLRRDPSAVLPATKQSGVLASGCVLGYGAPGAQCVPAQAPGGKPMTCAYLQKLFPGGIRVTGRDPLRLDTNGDGSACGRGDSGVSG